MFLKDVCKRLEQYFNFCVSKRMIAMVNDEIIYTFNSNAKNLQKVTLVSLFLKSL